MRYTAVVVLGVLVVTAVLWVARRDSPMRARWLALWGAAGAIGPALVLVYDWLVFGAPLRTGYSQGVSFSPGAVLRNLRTMPLPLLIGMPVGVLAATGVVWALVAARRTRSPARRRDLAVVACLVAWWLAVWLTYLAYDWTTVVRSSMSFPLTSRFYLPALGALAGLLAIAASIHLSFRYADRILRVVGDAGADVIIRLSAFILLCLGIQILWRGASALLSTTRLAG